MSLLWSLLSLVVVLTLQSPAVAATTADVIGLYTAVHGTVLARHLGTEIPQAVQVRDDVRFRDRIETHAQSHMRATLDDDSVLTLAADSRLEISEHVYDVHHHSRNTVVRLLTGSVRALVTKLSGISRFEVHTDTAVAAARGTYFVVWVEADGRTGIANIGQEGDVGFIAGGREVVVAPGHYSVTVADGTPGAPQVLGEPTSGRAVSRRVDATESPKKTNPDAPKEAVHIRNGMLTLKSDPSEPSGAPHGHAGKPWTQEATVSLPLGAQKHDPMGAAARLADPDKVKAPAASSNPVMVNGAPPQSITPVIVNGAPPQSITLNPSAAVANPNGPNPSGLAKGLGNGNANGHSK